MVRDYKMLEERLFGHAESVPELQAHGILMDVPPPTARSACCCKSSAKPCSARFSLNSSSARPTKALAKATSKRCLKAWSVTRFGGGRLWWSEG
jgi:hypothetical protein